MSSTKMHTVSTQRSPRERYVWAESDCGEAAMQGTATAMQQGEGSVFGAYIISTITDGRSAHSATIDHDSSAAKAPANRG